MKTKPDRRNAPAKQRWMMERLEVRQLLAVYNPLTSAALTSALNSAQLGDTIILQAGTTYVGQFTLPNKTTGSGWITIESSNLDALPPEGVRVSPADAVNMPRLQAPGSNASVLRTPPGKQSDPNAVPPKPAVPGSPSHNYKLIGIDFVGPANNSNLTALIELGTSTDAQTDMSSVPHDIVIDRSYMHPNVRSAQIRRAVALNSASTDITNSYIEEIHEAGSDSQAIGGWNGPGPFNIINNHLEAASENIMFGGDTARLVGAVPSNIVIRGNHVIKPLDWRLGTNGSNAWAVKNLFEIKAGRNILVEDNIFENTWVSGQDGTAILLKLGNWDTSPQNVDEDLIFRNNIVRHANAGITLQGRDYASNSPAGLVRRLTISNNVFDDINKSWSTGGTGLGGNFLYMTQGPVDATFDHNTVLNGRTIINVDTPQYPTSNFVFTNNITAHNTYGVFSSEGGTGNVTIVGPFVKDNITYQGYFNDDPANAPARFTKNILMGGTASRYSSRPGNYFPAAWSNVGFVDQTNFNYRLTSNSIYHNVGTDGTDLGANLDTVAQDFAWMSGTVLNVAFNPTAPRPIALTTDGSGRVVASYDGTVIPFTGVTSINVIGTPDDDLLQITGPLAPPMTFNNDTGNDEVDILGGSYTFTGDIGGAHHNVAVHVASNAAALFDATQHLRDLEIDTLGAATLTAGGSKVLVTKHLVVDGRLNLTDNDMVVDYDPSESSPLGTWSGSAYTGILGLIQTGRNGGDYQGNGIVTDQADAITPNIRTSMSATDASQSLVLSGSETAPFGSEMVDATSVLVKYTYMGDADLDGVITTNDYFMIDSGFLEQRTSWLNGDFDFDGAVSTNDYFVIDQNFLLQGAGL